MKKYIEVYNDIINKINTGDLKSGDSIPSVRKASRIYRVSITTIQNAYFELCADGYIFSVDKSGYYVTDRKKNHITIKKNPKREKIKYDLTGSVADKDSFDISLWQRYIKSALRQNDRFLSYSETQGEYDLREAISKYIYEKRNIIASPDRIVIGAGIQPLLQILCALLDKNKSVSFPDKSFLEGRGIFSDYGFDIHTRDKNADIIYVSPSHMTKWGDVMPIKRRLELIDYSQKNGSLVIEDDYENEFQYNNTPTPSLFALGKDNIVYLGSFSAMLLPAIRISFMVLNEELTRIFNDNAYRFAQTASLTEQIALCNYIRDGHIYSQTRKIRRLYTAKTKAFYNLLKKEMPNLDIKISENALQIIIHTKNEYTNEYFKDKNIRLYIADCRTIVLSVIGVPDKAFNEVIEALKVNIN